MRITALKRRCAEVQQIDSTYEHSLRLLVEGPLKTSLVTLYRLRLKEHLNDTPTILNELLSVNYELVEAGDACSTRFTISKRAQ